MKLGELKISEGARKKKKRVGCGPGSGHGKTCCRGHKGQNSRSGSRSHPWFEGGQMPLQRRVPKRGFHNRFKKVYQIINIKDLDRFSKDTQVDPRGLVVAGLVKTERVKIKLLGVGQIDRPLKISVHACTKSAREQVEKAGGEVRLLKG